MNNKDIDAVDEEHLLQQSILMYISGPEQKAVRQLFDFFGPIFTRPKVGSALLRLERQKKIEITSDRIVECIHE